MNIWISRHVLSFTFFRSHPMNLMHILYFPVEILFTLVLTDPFKMIITQLLWPSSQIVYLPRWSFSNFHTIPYKWISPHHANLPLQSRVSITSNKYTYPSSAEQISHELPSYGHICSPRIYRYYFVGIVPSFYYYHNQPE